MKFKTSLLPISAAGAIVLTAAPTFSQSNNSIGFRCDTIEGTPTTVVYNSKNQVKPLIHWKQEYIDSQNIRAACEGAAKKLQSRYDNNKLTLLAIDANNSNKPITVCLINKQGESCDVKSSEELLRLKTTGKNQDFQALSEIVNPNLGEVKANEMRTIGRTYARIESKKWFVFF
ncbi:COP23 domain-containing protein [Iningainema tapete]|uniref:Uncharacterized protein n=1 Tax=Iningainema tapete BLCC-T55 TaxID=2748662 RepID=A0A8J7BZS8_9CYAN|nr:COP23 domain-containing protein [Iningainema tapete]MBD2776598.1 hypothetical protein [Iningainema tapete BLCC-T55]